MDTELGHITRELTNQLGGLVHTDMRSHSHARRQSEFRQSVARVHAAGGGSDAVSNAASQASKVAKLVRAASASSEGGVVDHEPSHTATSTHHTRNAAATTKKDKASHLQNVASRKAAEVMRIEEQRAARKARARHQASLKAQHALLAMVKGVSESDKAKKKKKTVVSKAVLKAETLVKPSPKSKKEVPMSSRHDPAYVHAEADRDAEAQAYLKKLDTIKRAKLAAKEKVEKGTSVAPTHREDRNEIAEKYLKIMEQEKLHPHVTVQKAQDRTALAQKYLLELRKSAKGKQAPRTSKRNPKYLREEATRDTQAQLDMKLLKKREALVRKGSKVEKVKLSKAIVQGPDTLEKERQALTRPKTDRTAIANKDLKRLKPKLVSFKHDHVGSYFHDTKVPKAILKPPKLHLNTKAQRDL